MVIIDVIERNQILVVRTSIDQHDCLPVQRIIHSPVAVLYDVTVVQIVNSTGFTDDNFTSSRCLSGC